jgi:GNAT superfamily N-acetyltransferase
MTVREVRREDADRVTQLYLDACRRLSERDPEWGVPKWGPINRWILKTMLSDDAVCLVSEAEGAVVGLLLGSVTRHPAMPGVLGALEELMVEPRQDAAALKRELVDAGIAWARERGASPIQAAVGLGAPWTDDELSFWTSNGFEHDQTLVTRYFPEERARS